MAEAKVQDSTGQPLTSTSASPTSVCYSPIAPSRLISTAPQSAARGAMRGTTITSNSKGTGSSV